MEESVTIFQIDKIMPEESCHENFPLLVFSISF